MENELQLKEDGENDELVVPNHSRKRMVSWIVSRFALRQRKFFWIWIVSVSLIVFFSSGIILNACVRLPLFLLSQIPAIGQYSQKFLESEFGKRANEYVTFMANNSPLDNAMRGCIDFLWAATSFSNSNSVFMVVGVLSICAFALLFFQLVKSPSSLSFSKAGLSLTWGFFGLKRAGPLVAWSEVIGIRLRREGGTESPDGKIDIVYSQPRVLYRMIEPANAANENRFTIDLRNVERLETRHKLGELLERYAPPNTMPPEVSEILSATASNTYTELWLQALTAPSKRESLEPLPEGKQLREGMYLIAGQLGVGGQGTAYIAEFGDRLKTGSTESGQKLSLVVKEFVLPLYVDSNSRKAALRSFLDEADLLKKLDHERVVKLNDCFVEDHRGYLVMERVHGESLKQIVTASGALTESRVLNLLSQMLDVLNYLHSQKPPVVHRDFAPDNLILGDDDVLKLVDFNVAQQAENTMTGTIVGKQSYVPPEQLRGMATPASDIYAMGATLYFMLTGLDPEPLSVSHPKSVAAHVSEELDAIVARCTQLDERERFKSALEVQTALESLSGFEPLCR